jgi:hypothetical protein
MIQEPKCSLGLAAFAVLSLGGWLALDGLLLWYTPLYRSRCAPSNDLCGLGLVVPALLFTGTGAIIGLAAWLGATVSAVRRREVLSALSIGLLLPVGLVNAVLVHRHADGSLGFAGAWVLFSVASATLLASSLTRRPTARRLVAVAGLVLAVALLVATNLVG